MVEINNQRKAFLGYAGGLRNYNGRQKTRNHGYDVIVVSYLPITPITSKLAAKPKTHQQAPDATSFFPVGGMPTASSLARKDSLPKVRTPWHCSRLRSGAYL